MHSQDLPASSNASTASEKEWFPGEGRIVFELYDDRESVLRAEAAAIRKERPVYNVHHNTVEIEVSVKAKVNLGGSGLAAMLAAAFGLALLAAFTCVPSRHVADPARTRQVTAPGANARASLTVVAMS